MRPPSTAVDLETLDFLRGVAAIYVVINHARGAFFVGGSQVVAEAGLSGLSPGDLISLVLLQLTTLGQEFVVVFFVISGFAMANSVAHSTSTGKFYLKRIIRIWPPYLLAVAISVALCQLTGPLKLAGMGGEECAQVCAPLRVGAYAFYLDIPPFAPQFWSLVYEVIFYALCPILLVSRRIFNISCVVACCLAVAGLVVMGVDSPQSTSVAQNFVFLYLLYFLVGAALYRWQHLVPKVGAVAFVLIVAMCMCIAIIVKFWVGRSIIPVDMLMIVLASFAIVNTGQFQSYTRRFNLGRFSYSMYIFHYQILMVISYFLLEFLSFASWELRGAFWWILTLPIVVGGCWVLYLVSERPCSEYLRRLRVGERGASSVVAASGARIPGELVTGSSQTARSPI